MTGGDPAGATLAIVGVQLEISAACLASPDAYRAHLEGSIARALDVAGPADARLVVLPELAGHLALLALAPAAARKARTLVAALTAAAVRRPLEVLRGAATTRLLDPRHAVLAAIAPDAERFWRGVVGPLARRHGIHLVAGSHVRLGPHGDLTNASFLFAPDGRLLATTEKVNLIAGLEDRAPRALGLARGAVTAVPTVATPFGAVCTLIGYDGFRAPHTSHERFEHLPARIAERGAVAVVANPSASPGPWLAAWPAAEAAAERPITRAMHWQRDGLPASLAEVRLARIGVTAHLVGGVLDLGYEGASEILERTDAGVVCLARAATHDRGGHVVAAVSLPLPPC